MTTGWFLWGTRMTSRTPPSAICFNDLFFRGENHRTTKIQGSVWSEHSVCGVSPQTSCVCIDSWNLGGKSFQAVSKWGWTPLKWDEAATVYINTCVYCIIYIYIYIYIVYYIYVYVCIDYAIGIERQSINKVNTTPCWILWDVTLSDLSGYKRILASCRTGEWQMDEHPQNG